MAPEYHSLYELEMFTAQHIKEVGEHGSAVAVSQIAEFERLNEHLDIAVNVLYAADNGEVYPMHASLRLRAKNQVVLLLFHMTDTRNVESLKAAGVSELKMLQDCMHYALIHNPSKIFAKRFTAHEAGLASTEKVTHTKPRHFCYNCFSSYERLVSLEAHTEWCHTQAGQVYRIPEPGAEVTFVPKNKSFLSLIHI